MTRTTCAAPVPPIRCGSIGATEVGPISPALVHLQTGVLAESPQQIGAGLRRFSPPIVSRKEAIRQTQHALSPCRNDRGSQRDFVGLIFVHAGRPPYVGAAFQQAHETKRGISTRPAAGSRPSPCVFVFLGIGPIPSAAVQNDQTPLPIPGAAPALLRHRRPYRFLQSFHGLHPQPAPRL